MWRIGFGLVLASWLTFAAVGCGDAACAGPGDCRTGLACVDGTCVALGNECGATSPDACGDGQRCVAGRCTTASTVGDGGESDGGASPDASFLDASDLPDGHVSPPTPDGGTATADASPRDASTAVDSSQGDCVPGRACQPTEPCANGIVVCENGREVCALTGPKLRGDVCRAAQSVCDRAETCDGVTTTCPADQVREAGVTCREAIEDCDVPETCDGAEPLCPPDRLASPGEVCRAAANACDAPESCSGDSALCPPDIGRPVGTLCSPTSCTWGACRTSDCQSATQSGTCRDFTCDASSACVEASRPASQSCPVAEGMLCSASSGRGTCVGAAPNFFCFGGIQPR